MCAVKELEFTIVPVLEKYYNEDTAWGVFNFKTQDDIPNYIEYNDPFSSEFSNTIQKMGTIVGKMQKLYIGSEYRVKGYCEYNDKFHQYQYVPSSIVAIAPQSQKQQEEFLKVITTERIAQNILSEYPNVVEDVMNGDLLDIEYSKVKGVGEKTWHKIRDSILNNYVISDIITLLQPLGVTYNMIKKLLDSEPNPSLLKQKLLENPYIMTKIRGLGFKRVDDMALKLKPALRHSQHRLLSFIIYYLKSLGENFGHTWTTVSGLKNEVSNNIPECSDLVDDVLEHNVSLYKKGIRIGIKEYRDVEHKIFNLLLAKQKSINTNISFKETDLTKIKECILKTEKEQGFQYTEEQRNTILKALQTNLMIISGKAGTGKSSIARGILSVYKNFNYSVSACALSAKAAQRITEATGFKASTIHRLLGATGLDKFKYNEQCPLPTDVLFVDEGSMINASLFLNLLEAVNMNTRIIICGDHMQLPPIGYGNVFSDILHGKEFNSYQLTKPMRQAEMSGILSDANLIREGISPVSTPEPKLIRGQLKDMYYMFRENRETLNNIAISTFLSTAQADGINNVVIITPRRQNCLNSSSEINKIIQDKLLKNEEQSIEYGNQIFKLGAKIIQTVNNYEKNIFNGEIGYITYIGFKEEDGRKIQYCEAEYDDMMGFEGKKIVEYKTNELSEIELAYAMTCHRMQGSGIKTVIGIIDNTHYTLLDNCMLYTLITRAKGRCLLLAEPQAFIKSIKTNHNSSRQTWLSLNDFA